MYTFIRAGSVFDRRGEDTDLAEEHCDQKRGSGGVGGGGQEVGDPGGQREHRGGNKVVVDVLLVFTDELNLKTHHREAISVI